MAPAGIAFPEKARATRFKKKFKALYTTSTALSVTTILRNSERKEIKVLENLRFQATSSLFLYQKISFWLLRG